MNTTDTTEHTYPESVYRWVDQEQAEALDGTLLPLFTREIAERIASTKPEWARFDDTDIDMNALNDDGTNTAILWERRVGDRVVVVRRDIYRVDGEKISESESAIQIWGGEPAEVGDVQAARGVGLSLLLAADVLERIQNGTPLPEGEEQFEVDDVTPAGYQEIAVQAGDYTTFDHFISNWGGSWNVAPASNADTFRSLDAARDYILEISKLISTAEALNERDVTK